MRNSEKMRGQKPSVLARKRARATRAPFNQATHNQTDTRRISPHHTDSSPAVKFFLRHELRSRILNEGKGSATVSAASVGVPPTESNGHMLDPFVNRFRTSLIFWGSTMRRSAVLTKQLAPRYLRA